MSNVQGMDALIRRMTALGETKPVLRALQLSVIAEAQALVPRKTGHLQGSILPGELTEHHATVVVKANYGLYVEKGTGLYGPKHALIKPGKVMAWKGGGPSKVRLSGRSRVVGGQSLGSDVFAWSTKGARAQPFFEKGAKKAVTKSGLAELVVAQWNGAA
jgi:hypothetical protein